MYCRPFLKRIPFEGTAKVFTTQHNATPDGFFLFFFLFFLRSPPPGGSGCGLSAFFDSRFFRLFLFPGGMGCGLSAFARLARRIFASLSMIDCAA